MPKIIELTKNDIEHWFNLYDRIISSLNDYKDVTLSHLDAQLLERIIQQIHIDHCFAIKMIGGNSSE